MNLGTMWAHIGLNHSELDKGVDSTKAKLSELKGHADNASGAFTTLAGSFAAGNLIASSVQAIGSALMQIPGHIYQSVQAIDDFKVSVIQTAALVTTMEMAFSRHGRSAENIYANSKNYAEDLTNLLIKIDPLTALNLKNLQAITLELAKAGVVIDVNNKKHQDGLLALANAGAVASRNGANEVMLQSEIASLLRGEATARDMIGKLVKAQVQGDFKTWVEQHKSANDLLDQMTDKLSGFVVAGQDMNGTFGAVKSSLETTFAILQRAGLETLYQDVVALIGQMNEGLREHTNEIATGIQKAWLFVKGVVESVWNILQPFTPLFQLLGKLVVVIADGWGMIGYVLLPVVTASLRSALNLIFEMGRAVANVGIAFGNMVLGNFEAASRALSTGVGIAKNAWKDFKSYDAGADFSKRMGTYQAIGTKTARGGGYTLPKFTPPTEAKTGKGGMNEDQYIKDLERARESYKQYLDAFNARQLDATKQMYQLELAELKNMYDQGKITQLQYLEDKYYNQKDELEKEASLLQTAYKTATDAADKAEKAMFATKKGDTFDITRILQRNKAIKEQEEAYKKLQAVQAKSRLMDTEYEGSVWAAKKKVEMDAINLSIMQYEAALSNVDTMEKQYQIDKDDAASTRIALLELERIAQQKVYDQIKGEEPAAQQLRQQVIDKMSAINAKIVEQQTAITNRTAMGGAVQALRDYAEQVNNIGAQVQNTMGNMLKGMEDALVDFVKTGKLSFKDLADSIIKDMIRIAIQQTITKPLSGLMSGGLGMLGGLFGGGGVGLSNEGTDVLGHDVLGSLAVGSDYIPQTGLYQLHQGEKVVPAAENTGATINVPVSIGNPRMASELRTEIESACERVLRRSM